MSYTFRIRFNRAPLETIRAEASEVELLPTSETGVSLSLRATSGKSLKDDEGWALIGEGYSSDEDARAEGSRIEDTLIVTLTKLLLGADFGNLVPIRGQFTTEGLRQVEQLFKEERLLDDRYGLSVYLSDPKPKFLTFAPKLTIEKDPDKFKQTFLFALKQGRPLTARERHSSNLFLASYFQPAADSRFLLQVMAVEALIEPALKSSDAIAYVDDLIKQLNNSPLSEVEKRSLRGGIDRLRQVSLTQAVRRLAAQILGNNHYDDKPASQFFDYAYKLRHKLVHGGVSAFEDIARITAPMELFVSDLLTVPLLGQAG